MMAAADDDSLVQKPPRPPAKKRSDFQRSRELLIETVGQVTPSLTRPASLAEIARHAGLGQATAYRHFSSLDELLGAYFFEIVNQLNEHSQSSPLEGPSLFNDVAKRWIELVLVNGRAMVQIRSPRGYIERLHEGVDYVVLMDKALQRPISELLRSWDLDPIGNQALQLWNVIFDPREVLDLVNSMNFSKPEIIDRLTTAFKGALFAVATTQRGMRPPYEKGNDGGPAR